MSPVALTIIAVVVVGVIAFFGWRAYQASQPIVEGTESMPDAVRKAYTGQGAKPAPSSNP